MNDLYSSSGVLRYSISGGYKLVVEIQDDLAIYYRSLIPKYLNVNKTRYSPHITVVRSYKEIPKNLEYWGKYEGEVIEFFYEPIIRQGKVYFWLNILCKRLEEIRQELGLEVTSIYTRPPEGFEKYFHMTIGNTKVDCFTNATDHGIITL